MIRGTTHDQDARFCDKTKKMLEKSQWPDKYDIKIDLSKVFSLSKRLTSSWLKCGYKKNWQLSWENRMT
jgi:hypothetical protein